MFLRKVSRRRLHISIFGVFAASLAVSETQSNADAALGRYLVNAGTVFDTKTKLTWQQLPAPSSQTWIEATQYCALLTTNDMEWRLPSVKELGTLVDESRSNPAIDPVAFAGTLPRYFWTSSPVAAFPRYAWAVDFNHGGDNFFDVSLTQLVRCVH